MENSAPLVSVVVPVYKTEKYVEGSILSLIHQTYSNIEIVCVNDASPDHSVGIVRRMQKEYSNIRIIENEKNEGLEKTRNTGINASKGKYLCFLDSDDTLEPNAIEELVFIAETNQTDIVISGYNRVVNEEKKVISSKLETGLYDRRKVANALLEELPVDITSCVGTKFYNLDFINSNRIRFDSKYKFNEDLGFAIEAISKCSSIYYTSKSYYNYLIRSQASIMSSYRAEMFFSISRVYSNIKDFFQTNGIFEEKKTVWSEKVYYLLLNSLQNEVFFTDYKRYKAMGIRLKNTEFFEEIYPVLIGCDQFSKKHKFILKLINNNMWGIIFLLIKSNYNPTRR